jgi:uncharacterized protein YndB with AHSA1/START domain
MDPANLPDDAIRKTLEIGCSSERAFEVFAEQMGRWWPREHHLGDAPFRDVRIDRFPGGDWYEVDDSGRRCPWGRVLAYEPPHRLLLAWHLDTQFSFDPAVERASEIEVRFLALAPDRTRVEFEHRHLRRHGAGYEELTQKVGSDGGWGGILKAYVGLASHPSSTSVV